MQTMLFFLEVLLFKVALVSAATQICKEENTYEILTCGAPGMDGIKGSNGENGAKGDTGVNGITGMPGIEGPRGPKGDLGPLGPKGDKGDSTNPGLDSRITRLEDQLKYLESNLLAKLKKQEKVLQYCEGTAQSGDKTYVSAGVQASFNDAQIACKKLGGELATPRNAAENVAVNSVVKYFKTSAYLGITDQKKDRVFRYPDGKPITYKNWSSTEPNNYGGKGEYCVEMYVDGAWNDIVCDLKRLAVCEII